MKIIDISLPISEGMIVYPGTEPTSIKKVPSPTGTSVVSNIGLTSHTGTHIDAPVHSLPETGGIDSFELSAFYGPCRVLDLSSSDQQIRLSDIEKYNIQSGERILFKTSNSARRETAFYDDYVFLGSDTAEFLAEVGVVLVGIDSLSIKQRGSSDHTPHTALLGQGIAIIEGLDLSLAEEGQYTLSAFPLKVGPIDGSPCRAVLITD